MRKGFVASAAKTAVMGSFGVVVLAALSGCSNQNDCGKYDKDEECRDSSGGGYVNSAYRGGSSSKSSFFDDSSSGKSSSRGGFFGG